MTTFEQNLIVNLRFGRLSVAEFYRKFPVDIRSDSTYITAELQSAIDSQDAQKIDFAISLLSLVSPNQSHIELLNILIGMPCHYNHQMIVKMLQDLKSPTSVPFIRKALQSGFDYLKYTGSDSGDITKWFSWALAEIDTDDAWALIEESGLSYKSSRGWS